MPSLSTMKCQAAARYYDYYAELDRYDCGKAVAEQINPRLLKAKQEFNALMDRMAEIDPTCPTFRL